ncbi:MAG: hypothetical protein R3331_09285 [Sulfurospirillaceae bacterium]|nr:hypothetical protein [Sulfurospirillaceae bacterium]
MWKWLTNNAQELKSVGTLVGGLGQGYAALSQAKAMDKVNNLNLGIYDYNKKRQAQADANLKLGFANSTLAKGL